MRGLQLSGKKTQRDNKQRSFISMDCLNVPWNFVGELALKILLDLHGKSLPIRNKTEFALQCGFVLCMYMAQYISISLQVERIIYYLRNAFV